VALSTAVTVGEIDVEGMVGRLAAVPARAVEIARAGEVGVVVASDVPSIDADVVIDARLAKRNIDTTLDDGSLVIALGPGFVAALDCHAVIETMRGPRLGRVIWDGPTEADTGTPGTVGGQGVERVVRSPAAGVITWSVEIGDEVDVGELLGQVDDQPIHCRLAGRARGLIRSGTTVAAGLKIGDVDPRLDVAHDEISDKALAVGGGVLEAVMTWLNTRT
jgi:xanthine dehydrogenase accessory factor